MSYPRRVVVSKAISSRYRDGERPVFWEKRQSGPEEIETTSGEKLQLLCSGGQSSPQVGWEILLTSEAEAPHQGAVNWTLFGIKRTNQA